MTQKAATKEIEREEIEDDEEILDVADLAPSRKKLRTLDGEIVEIRSPKELSLHERSEVDRLKARLDQLQEKKKLVRKEEADLERTFNNLARLALVDVSDEEFDALGVLDKDQVIGVFTAAFVVMQRNMAEGTARTLGLLKPKDEEDEEDGLDDQTQES